MGHVVLLQQFLTETEICQFDHSIVEQNVRRFEISMQNMRFIQNLKGRPQLFEYMYGLFLRKSAFLLDMLSKSAAVAELIDQIVVVVGAEHLNEADDIGVRHFAEDVDFVVGKLRQFGRLLELVHVHHLDCELAL